MKTYSVIHFTGSQQDVQADGLPLAEASKMARENSSGNDVVAVVDDETDVAVATEVYSNGKKIEPGLIRSIVFGLGRCM